MRNPKTPPKAAALIAAAVLVAAPLTKHFEGLRTRPYRDASPRHVMSVCYGETKVRMRVYTPAECTLLLEARQREDFAPVVLRCVPGVGPYAAIFASAIDASYNAGPGNFCKSPMAAWFNRRQWRAGCLAYRGWHDLPGTKVHRGLAIRRETERSLCMKGVPK